MIDHKYLASGLRNVFLSGGIHTWVDEEGDVCERIEAEKLLNSRIAELLLAQAPYLNGEMVKWFRGHIGFMTFDFARKLGVSERELALIETAASTRVDPAFDEKVRTLVSQEIGFNHAQIAWPIDDEYQSPFQVKLVFQDGLWLGAIWY